MRATGLVSLDDLLAAIEHEVPAKTTENVAAARTAYDDVVMGVGV